MVNKSTIRLIKELSTHITVVRICEILGVSRTTYYRHLKHLEEAVTYTEQELRIHQLCVENHFLYGYRKIHALLNKEMYCSISKVQRIMNKHNWGCQFKQKRFNKPGNPYKVVDNIIDRDWITNRPLQKLTTDITYLPFGSSNLYLCSILDTYNSEIVAYKISDRQDVTLAVDTLNQLPKLTETTILHSDQGAVFTSKKFFDLVRKKSITRSMSHKGTPCDNAPIESFHSSLKSETFYHQMELSSSKDIIIETVENYINFWNNKRIFTKLGHQSPVKYRKSKA
ncbi:transposase [Companilactobacillus sp. RD055328]|uniref:IS3 family transposase n=1 Tax=Companilactobacillus sp. RD055328 TaxID=2916634 RepID=UPI001FC861D2|nr:IS3 family transposase [Companilactobacillus sp. RD055328]GKQ43016.1 transposase [Companilactobacillus sp. RD055328]